MPNIDALKYSKKLLKKYSTFRTNNNDAYIAIPGKKPGNFIVARVGDTIFDDFIETDFERKYK